MFIGGLGALGSDYDRCVAMLLSRPDIGFDCQIVTFDHRCVGQSVKVRAVAGLNGWACLQSDGVARVVGDCRCAAVSAIVTVL